MFSKNKLNVSKVNETMEMSSKVLKVLYFLLMMVSLYILIIIFKESRIFVFIKTLIKVVSPLFIGLIIAFLFNPFVKFLEGKGIKRIFGAVITYVCMFSILALVLYSLIPILAQQVREFLSLAPSIIGKVKDWASDLFNHLDKYEFVDASLLKKEIFSDIENFGINITTNMPKNFLGFVSKLFSFVGTFILGLILGFFLIVNLDDSSKFFSIIPKRYRDGCVELFDDINVSLRSYVRGAVIDCIVIFILSSLGLFICGLKFPVLFGLFCGLTNIIPYAGPYIGGAPAVIVGFTQSPGVGLFSFIVIFIIQFLEGNFLQPLIMSKTTRLHPVTILLGLLVFGYFFGIIGMLISTPVIAICKTIFKFYNNRYKIINREELEG